MSPHLKPSAGPVLAYLQTHGWVTEWELIEQCHATNAGRRRRELGAAGYVIERRRRYDERGRARSTFEYRLVAGDIATPGAAQAQPAAGPVRAINPAQDAPGAFDPPHSLPNSLSGGLRPQSGAWPAKTAYSVPIHPSPRPQQADFGFLGPAGPEAYGPP